MRCYASTNKKSCGVKNGDGLSECHVCQYKIIIETCGCLLTFFWVAHLHTVFDTCIRV